jgi:hypothetical protein
MSKYDLEEVRRRMKGIPVGWKPRPELEETILGLTASVPFPQIEIPLPIDEDEEEDDLLRTGDGCQDCWWIDNIGVSMSIPTDPSQNPKVTVTLGWFVASAAAIPEVGIDRCSVDYSWEADSGELTYLGPTAIEPIELRELRETPCWRLVQPSIHAALSTIADSICE